jgi:hypothetical protein
MFRHSGFLLRDARSFWISPALTAEKLNPRKTTICREAQLIVFRINDFSYASYAATVSYASLSIMFLSACEFKNFLTIVAAILNIPCRLLTLHCSVHVGHV